MINRYDETRHVSLDLIDNGIFVYAWFISLGWFLSIGLSFISLRSEVAKIFSGIDDRFTESSLSLLMEDGSSTTTHEGMESHRTDHENGRRQETSLFHK